MTARRDNQILVTFGVLVGGPVVDGASPADGRYRKRPNCGPIARAIRGTKAA